MIRQIRRILFRFLTCCSLLLLLVSPIQGGSLPEDYDCAQEEGLLGIEDVFGPGNVTGITGNGSLTGGFGYAGELTLLRWPSPSYFDQVRYMTPFLTLACKTRKLPRNGAQENMGSFAGLYLERGDGSGEIHWFRDEDWNHNQYYLSPDSPVMVTESVNPELGITVTTLNYVVPGRDVLVRHYEVAFDPGTSFLHARLLYYENMEIITRKIPYAPIMDSALEKTGDFAVLYHAGSDALIHFRPQDPDSYEVPQPGTSQQEVDAWVDGLDNRINRIPFDPERTEMPVYIAIGVDFSGAGTTATSDGHQCGLQDKIHPLSPLKRGAFWDSLDGRLSGNSSMAGNVDAALMKTLDPGLGHASFTVYVTAGHCAADAFSNLAWARARGHEALLRKTNRFWRAWLARAILPDTEDPKILAVCKRALITVLQGWDSRTGAFVASVTSQPPYSVNWPRDGVFFAHVMDVAGFPKIAERNYRFYSRVQRNCKDPRSPRCDLFCKMGYLFRTLFGWDLDGTYDMAYYADGVPGGPVFFEIDNAGFASWGMLEHASFLHGKKRTQYLCGDLFRRGVYPALRKTGDALAACITPGDTSGLQCAAFEDDTVVLGQTLNGAMAVYLALDAAIKAGTICGESSTKLEGWKARVKELSAAIETHFWDPVEGHYMGTGPGSYLIWPARYPLEGERLDSQCRYLFSEVKKHLNKEERSTAYISKAVLALAYLGWDTGDPDFNLGWAIDVLLKEGPTALGHYGEAFLAVDLDNDGELEFSNRVAVPHLWEASLAYLSAMAYFGPANPQSGER